MASLTERIHRFRETGGKGKADIGNSWGAPLIYATDINPKTGKRYMDAPEYGRDGRMKDMAGKHLAEIELDKANIWEYFGSRGWPACGASGLMGIAWEYIRAPATLLRFVSAKHKYVDNMKKAA
jgi:hypothetical protein